MSRNYAGENATIRVQNRRIKLIKAGLKCFSTKGLAKTTIKDICSAAELTERYFYESFKNKEALLGVVYESLMDEMNETITEVAKEYRHDPEEALLKISIKFFELLRDQKYRAQIQLFEVLGVSETLDQLYRRKMDETEQTLNDLLQMLFPEYANKDIPQVYLSANSGAYWQVANKWVLSGFKEPIENLAVPLSNLMMTLLRQALR